MSNAVAVEGINRLASHSAKTHWHDAVFDMDNGHAARLEHSVKIRCEKIHLPEKFLIALRVAEVCVIGRIFVLCRKWN